MGSDRVSEVCVGAGERVGGVDLHRVYCRARSAFGDGRLVGTETCVHIELVEVVGFGR